MPILTSQDIPRGYGRVILMIWRLGAGSHFLAIAIISIYLEFISIGLLGLANCYTYAAKEVTNK